MPLGRRLRLLAARLARGDEGFSMVVVMIAVMMMSATAAAALTAVDGDQAAGRSDVERKTAYSAAEAGLQAYLHRLNDYSSYWTLCTGYRPTGTTTKGSNQTDAVNQWWNGVSPSADPRRWANLADGSGQYTIEELPANGKNKCDPNDPVATMIDDDTATFRIRVTGRALDPNLKPVGPRRSILATFKRKSFLDYIYFTDYEVLDPTLYPDMWARGADETKENPGNNDFPGQPGGQRDLATWGNMTCAVHGYEKAGNGLYRDDQNWIGSSSRKAGYRVGSTWTSRSAACTDTGYTYNAAIRFASDDVVKGPFHSNDSPMVCGSPDFGNDPGDAIETSAPGNMADTTLSHSWRVDNRSGCSPSQPDVNFNGSTAKANRGSWIMNSPPIDLPPTNQSMEKDAPASYTFLGNTKIVLSTTNILVTGKRQSDGQMLNNTPLAYPADGVIFVQNDPNVACSPYDVSDAYASRPGCGIASVSGKYGNSLTIGAADDILITGDILNGGGSKTLLGLIAQNFIRVQHKIDRYGNNDMSGSNYDQQIDAALLTLKHSFLVDNWRDGNPLGTLTVNGAISQRFRGPVATGSGRSTASGYVKNYVYDKRLRTLSPPKFLDPVKAAWRLKLYQEQTPAT